MIFLNDSLTSAILRVDIFVLAQRTKMPIFTWSCLNCYDQLFEQTFSQNV